jgi:hypothetical protein
METRIASGTLLAESLPFLNCTSATRPDAVRRTDATSNAGRFRGLSLEHQGAGASRKEQTSRDTDFLPAC